MKHREAAETAWKSYPDKFALAASVCILVGMALFFGSVAWEARAKQLGGDGGSLLGWISLASVALVYLVAPLMGVAAASSMSRILNAFPDCVSRDGARAARAARRFSIGAPLFILVGALPLILILVLPGAAPLLGIWCVGVLWLGIAMGRITFRLVKVAGLGLPRAGIGVTVAVVPVLIAAGFAQSGLASYLFQRVTYSRKTPTFSGDSQLLTQTLVVPTLDTPCSQGKNIIWCSSFQLAWNEVRDRVIGEPLEVIGAEEVAARLNAAEQSTADLEPQSFYAAGGRGKERIIERIEREMAAKFPSHDLPDFNDYPLSPEHILAYSYLKANVPFRYPYRQLDEGLAFVDSNGVQTQVAGFGLWEAFLPRYKNLREQVEILYYRASEKKAWELQEYALDLCRHSEPYQVVVAVVEPRASLAEALDYVRSKTEQFSRRDHCETARRFCETDILRVPEIFWRIDHRFRELIGKVVANAEPANPIVEALQTIEFRLDRSGAMLESQATLVIAAIPRTFAFDRPFLVYMKKRGAEHPFFVMWVDNAELLVPAQ